MTTIPNFKNNKLFEQAFNHRSYLNEAKEKISSNERLEFLGDSILSFVVSNYLFNRYNNFDEGTLTNIRSLLVNTKNLALISKELNFGSLLKLSKGEEESFGRQNQSLLADCFEAFLGALYLDQGLEVVSKFIEETLLIKTIDIVGKRSLKDPKSLLQERVQATKQISPIYKVIDEKGPAHEKLFIVGVYVQNEIMGEGRGKSKQEAEENAAEIALSKYHLERKLKK